jgi:ankyrin repeat protein
MFLLARLHVESLASAAGLSVKHVRKKLETLPNTLTGAYDNILQRIEDQEADHKRIAFKTLAWVSYALRSLSLKELQHALAIEPGDTQLDEEMVMDGHSITSLCAGLIVVDQATNVVNLVHYSTKSYFEDNRAKYFPNFNGSITLSLATYLTLNELKNVPIGFIVQRYPLACYAAQYLGEHARNTPEEALEPGSLEVICQLLSHPDKRKPLLSLLDGLDVIRGGFYSSNKQILSSLSRSSTYVAADAALPSLFEYHKSTTEDALQFASQLVTGPETVPAIDQSSAASTFTSLGINASTSFEDDASEEGSQETNVWEDKMKASRIPEVTALHLAASMGLAKVASMLLKETPNIDAVDETGKTALALAIERGFEKAVEFLVNSGACVDLRHDHGRLTLLRATERDWQNVGNIIVERARIAMSNEDPEPVYHQVKFILATYYGHVEEMLQLVQRADFNLKTTDRSTGEMALFLAVEREHLTMVQSFLNAGVDVNSRDITGQTALHRPTRRANEAMVRLLLANKAEVDAKDDDGRTPWSANIRSRNSSILRILLQAGADPSTKGLQGVSELYTAAKDGDTELVRFMLDSGTNPSVQTEYNWAPLHWAASYGHIDCVKLLVEAGADLSVISDQNVTPLDLAIHSDQHAIIDILQREGAKKSQDLPGLANSVETIKGLEQEGDWINVEESMLTPEESMLTPEENNTVLSTKLVLVFDKPLIRTLINNKMVGQFLYPRKSTEIPSPDGYIYQVSHVLESQTSSISIRRARRRVDMHEYPLHLSYFDETNALYSIQRTRPDYQEFEIQGRHQNPLPGTIRMHRDWTGSWKIRHNHANAKDQDYLFRTTADWNKLNDKEESSWINEDSELLARTGWDDATPNICFEKGLKRQMVDLMVTCWVAKLWSETVTLQRNNK